MTSPTPPTPPAPTEQERAEAEMIWDKWCDWAFPSKAAMIDAIAHTISSRRPAPGHDKVILAAEAFTDKWGSIYGIEPFSKAVADAVHEMRSTRSAAESARAGKQGGEG